MYSACYFMQQHKNKGHLTLDFLEFCSMMYRVTNVMCHNIKYFQVIVFILITQLHDSLLSIKTI